MMRDLFYIDWYSCGVYDYHSHDGGTSSTLTGTAVVRMTVSHDEGPLLHYIDWYSCGVYDCHSHDGGTSSTLTGTAVVCMTVTAMMRDLFYTLVHIN